MNSELDGFHEYPKCHGTIDIDLSECLFFEDLNQRSFSILDKSTEVITVDHANLVMKTLAKFHAISFALKDQQPEKFAELTSNLVEIFLQAQDDVFKQYYNNQAKSALDTVANDDDIEYYTKLKNFFKRDALDIMIETLNVENIGSTAVIAHGDAWQNNIMFKYDKNGKPIEISLLDWQIARHASPISDLVYFLFCCTTKELRDAHYKDFLQLYHDTLSAHIRR